MDSTGASSRLPKNLGTNQAHDPPRSGLIYFIQEGVSAMKEAMSSLLVLTMQQSGFLAQIAADVSALKAVVGSFNPDTEKALSERIAVERANIQEHMQSMQMLASALRTTISQMPN
jgi:hypothetical protein